MEIKCTAYGIVDINNPDQFIYVGITAQPLHIRMTHLIQEVAWLNTPKTKWLKKINWELKIIQDELTIADAVQLKYQITTQLKNDGHTIINHIEHPFKKKYHEKRKINIENKLKKVQQFSLDGELIETFDSIKQAHLKLNIRMDGLSNALNGRQKTAGGFIWKFL